MIKKLKEIFDNWFLDAVQRNSIVQQNDLEMEIQDAKEDVWSDTVSKYDLDMIQDQVDDIEGRVSDIEDSYEDVVDRIDELVILLKKKNVIDDDEEN